MEMKKKVNLIVLGVLLGGVFHCLFIDNVWAIEWNSTAQLITNTAPYKNGEAYSWGIMWDSTTSTWFFKNDIYISRFEQDFDIRLDGWHKVKDNATGQDMDKSDCTLALSRDWIECYGTEMTSSPDETAYINISKDNVHPSGQTLLKDCAGLSGGGASIPWVYIEDTEGTYIWQDDQDNTVYYSEPGNYACDGAEDGTLSIPAGYETVEQPVLLTGHNGYHYLFFESEDSGLKKIYYAVFDSGYNYISLTGGISSNNTHNSSKPRAIRMSGDNPEYIVTYLTNDSHRTINIKHFAVGEDQNLNLIQTEKLVPYNVFNNASGCCNYTAEIGLERQYNRTSGENRLWLFYQIHNDTVGRLGIYGLPEDTSCDVGNWVNTTQCTGDYLRQQRWTQPSGCEAIEQWVYHQDCVDSGGDLTEIVKSERFCEIDTCVSNGGEWSLPWEDSKASCTAFITVDSDCDANMYSNATLTTNVFYSLGLFDDLGDARYYLLFCNPVTTDDCFDENPLCSDQWNRTQTLSDTSISPGEELSAYFEMSNVQQCARKTWLGSWTGWHRYQVAGQLQYCCDRVCGGYKCVSRGDFEYSAIQYKNCGINDTSKEFCSLGCVERTGRCLTTTEADPGISGNIFDWIKGRVESLMPPWVLLVFSIMVSLGIGAWAYSMSDRSNNMLLVGVLGGVILFLSLGWIPQIFGILWILTIAIILAMEYRKGVES